jgi:hypothetical protein
MSQAMHSQGIPDLEGPKLHVLVQEGTRELCRVAMPTRSVDNLQDLFPDEDRDHMIAIGIDLAAIAQRVATSGYAPQVVLEAKASGREYRLWIA